MTQRPPIFDQMSAVADTARSRLLLLLEDRELTVSELCAVVQLPQSTVSRHLKILADSGWISSRRNGTSRLYCLRSEELDPERASLWDLIHGQVSAAPSSEQDARRLETVLDRRRVRSQEFFASAASEWDRVRDKLFGRGFYPSALLGLLDDRWVVGDLGSGTGRVAELIAPFVERVIAVDGSEAMLQAARERLNGMPNVEFRRGELEDLPIRDGRLDAATLVLVLPHLPDPGKVATEVARVLRPGGRMLIVDLLPHDRIELQREMGHVWMGFSESQIKRYVRAAGFDGFRFEPLPADAEARGPLLFAASCRRGEPTRKPVAPTEAGRTAVPGKP